MAMRHYNRFLNPKRLTPETRVLGATAEQWDRALTGNLAQKLEEVRRRVAAVAVMKTANSEELSENVPLDLGSTIHRKRTSR